MVRAHDVMAAVLLCMPVAFVCCEDDDGGDGNGGGGRQIAITAPAAGAKYVGGVDTITVSYTPAMSAVKVEFNYNDAAGSDDQYAVVTSVTTVDQNTVKFLAPGRNMSEQATIRISDPTGVNTAGVSPAIKVKHIILTEPADGSVLRVGQPFVLRWRSNGNVPGVNVKTSYDSGETWTIHNVGGQVSPTDTDWANFPVTLATPAVGVLVRVESYIDPSVQDVNVITVQ